MTAYVQEQASQGRFEHNTPPRLLGLKDYLVQGHIIPNEVKLQLAMCLAFLIVCLLNISALIFARFQQRTHEISVRRALGARRRDIIGQLCTEAAIVGVVGGVFGLLVAQAGLYLVRRQPEDYAALASMDLGMVGFTLLLACGSSLLAALFPAIRATSGRLAMQIKASE
jgi:putative ABC transport system permease protein